jgi:hypothetical protein
MMLSFLPEAGEEFAAAALWYESQEAGLGIRFREEVGPVVGKIAADPLLWRERLGGWRRVNCPVFPYVDSRLSMECLRRLTVRMDRGFHGIASLIATPGRHRLQPGEVG